MESEKLSVAFAIEIVKHLSFLAEIFIDYRDASDAAASVKAFLHLKKQFEGRGRGLFLDMCLKWMHFKCL